MVDYVVIKITTIIKIVAVWEMLSQKQDPKLYTQQDYKQKILPTQGQRLKGNT